MNGIDVSRWQPADITDKVSYDFAIIKATEGTGYVSPACDSQYQKAKAKGKKLGVYHFASGGDANAEAEYFVNNIKGYLGEAILVLDYESKTAVGKGREWVRTFVKKVYELTKVHPLVYASRDLINGQNLTALLSEENCGLWLAGYPLPPITSYTAMANERGEVIRQYTSSGKLAGYSGNLDLNYAFINAEQWNKYAKSDRDGNAAPVPEYHPPVATDPAPQGKNTYVVQSGDTLSGIAQKFGVSTSAITGYKSGNPNVIYPGEVLTINGGSNNTPASSAKTYTVKSGDNLSSIAKQFGVGINDISGYRSGNPNIIYVGEVLTIGGSSNGGGSSTYTVKSGDTLSGIGAKLGVSWKTLQQMNGIADANKIYPGQVLRY